MSENLNERMVELMEANMPEVDEVWNGEENFPDPDKDVDFFTNYLHRMQMRNIEQVIKGRNLLGEINDLEYQRAQLQAEKDELLRLNHELGERMLIQRTHADMAVDLLDNLKQSFVTKKLFGYEINYRISKVTE